LRGDCKVRLAVWKWPTFYAKPRINRKANRRGQTLSDTNGASFHDVIGKMSLQPMALVGIRLKWAG